MSPGRLAIAVVLLVAVAAWAGDDGALYRNDFQSAAVDGVPDDFLVLSGAFAVKQEGENRFLELPGTPLESFGVLFGPTESVGVMASARIQGVAKGRRYPSFGVGLNGVSGYRLMVSPGKEALEILLGDVSQKSVSYSWKSESWTHLLVRVRRDGSKWVVEGKAWPQDQREPGEWLITLETMEEPSPGRASIWGSPYSGRPIRFDDLVVKKDGSKQ